eukprot:CAMPEP_0183600024 /NCGR_PEP_ID=MMETSP0371-20130417/179726_1 /TAXON_ID=268820 /ORGANISM="Peridinium aciculiferum, Strain PAER-2" /LENGTH=79 /DNA_ID=CAMNT_0025812095 /DNA_START=520 /DNA_END=759 /DNA_ORIENTATION=-
MRRSAKLSDHAVSILLAPAPQLAGVFQCLVVWAAQDLLIAGQGSGGHLHTLVFLGSLASAMWLASCSRLGSLIPFVVGA